MSMLAGQVDVVIGVDTHRDTNTAALVDATTSGVLAHTACSTDALGLQASARLHRQTRPRPAGPLPYFSSPRRS